MLRLRDIMTTDMIAASPEMNIREAMDLLTANHISGAPVVDRGRVLGVFSSSDLLAFVSELDSRRSSVTVGKRRTLLEEVTVADVMTRDLQSLGPDCPVELAASFMRRADIHRVLVMQDQQLVGIVTTTDLAAAVADHKIRTRTYVFA